MTGLVCNPMTTSRQRNEEPQLKDAESHRPKVSPGGKKSVAGCQSSLACLRAPRLDNPADAAHR